MRNYIDEFLDKKAVEDGVSLNTLSAYKRDIVQFSDSLKNIDILNVKKNEIENYFNLMRENGFCAKTISRKISSIKEFFKFLVSENVIKANPLSDIISPKIGKSLPKFLTDEEINSLCICSDASNTPSLRRMKVMIKLMFSSGLRVSELVSLLDNSINYDLKQIRIKGKGAKERIVPLSKEVAFDIHEYCEYRNCFLGKENNHWLFPSLRSNSGHITRDAFFKNLKKLSIIAGVSPSRVHPHVLRHSFATKLVNKKADLRSIQKMLGHEHIVTTEIYTHITTKGLVEEVKSKHPLANKK